MLDVVRGSVGNSYRMGSFIRQSIYGADDIRKGDEVTGFKGGGKGGR